MLNDVKRIVDEALDHSCVSDGDGNWRYDIKYSGYEAELSAGTIREIAGSDDPRAAFNELLSENFDEQQFVVEKEIFDGCIAKLDDSEFEYDEDEVRDYVYDHLEIYVDAQGYLDNNVCVNIIVDNGDANYDFTKNNFAHRYYGEYDEIEDTSSLLWLAEQQGCTKEELEQALEDGTAFSGPVLALLEAKNNACKVLEEYGYCIEFGRDRSTGRYAEAKSITWQQMRLKGDINRLKNNFENSPKTYEEYVAICEEKNINPHSEEWFLEKISQVEVDTKKRIAEIEGKLAELDQGIKDKDLGGVMAAMDTYKYLSNQFAELAQTEEYKKAKFINSVIDTSASITSHMNALTFCVQMTLGEYFELRDAIDAEKSLNNSYETSERRGTGEVVLYPSTKTMLYDSWNGAGSLGFVDLKEEVHLPVKLISSAEPDGTNGCSIMQIYGTNEEFYTGAVKKICPMSEKEIEKVKNEIEHSKSLSKPRHVRDLQL